MNSTEMYSSSVWEDCPLGHMALGLWDHNPATKTAILTISLVRHLILNNIPISLYFFTVILLCIHGDWYPNLFNSFIENETCMSKALNEEDKISRNKYILKQCQNSELPMAWWLRQTVSWVTEPRDWAIYSRCFEGTYCLHC